MVDIGQVREALSGPVPTLATPFLRDGSVDWGSLRGLIDFVIEEGGARSVVLTHGDSLFTSLTADEITELTRVVVEHTAGRAMTVAADDAWPTSKAIEFAKYVRELGSDMLMLMPPTWGGSCTPETLANHYAAVAVHIPVMIVTNVFKSMPKAAALDTLTRTMAKTDNVLAVKDDIYGEFGQAMCLLVHDRMATWAGGQKKKHMFLHPYGCDGYLSTFISFKPSVAHDYWQAIESNDLTTAMSVIARYDEPFFDFIVKLRGGFDAGIHGALELFGITERWRRPPYYSLNDEEMESLKDFFTRKELL